MSTLPTAAPARTNYGAIAIVGALFFIFGFVTWLNGPLIAFAKLAFNVSDALAFLIPSAFYLSYFFLALPSSAILRKTGMKKGMALGLFAMAVGALVFGQYTTGRVYAGAVTGVFIIGAGLAILQTASNPYISILGPIEGAAQRIAIMGICNKLAGMAAPFVIGTLVMHGMSDLSAQVAVPMPPPAKPCSTHLPRASTTPTWRWPGCWPCWRWVFCSRHYQSCAPKTPMPKVMQVARKKTASSSTRMCGWGRCASLCTWVPK